MAKKAFRKQQEKTRSIYRPVELSIQPSIWLLDGGYADQTSATTPVSWTTSKKNDCPTDCS